MKRVFAALNIQIFVCLLVSFMLLLCGCNRSETSSDASTSSAPETVQTTQKAVTKSSVLTPQEELEKLAPVPQTAQCPICGGTNLQVTLASAAIQKGDRNAQKCIHYLEGEDYIYPLSLRVYDSCLSCTDTENPWHGDKYDVLIGSSTICHGYQ